MCLSLVWQMVPNRGMCQLCASEQFLALQILIDDPDLDVSDEARDIWAARVKKYLPYCAIWCRDLKGLQQKLQGVQYQYASLQLEDPSLNESQLGHRLHKSLQMSSGCKPTVHDSEYFIK